MGLLASALSLLLWSPAHAGKAETMVRRLTVASVREQKSALEELRTWSAADQTALVPLLIALARDRSAHRTHRWTGISALGLVAGVPKAQEAVAPLVEIAGRDDEDLSSRMLAVSTLMTLGRAGRDVSSSVGALIAAVRQRQSLHLSVDAADALGSLGIKAAAAAPALEELIDREGAALYWKWGGAKALAGLAAVTAAESEPKETLVAELDSKAPRRRWRATYGLVRKGPAATDELRSAHARSRDSVVRAVIEDALQSRGVPLPARADAFDCDGAFQALKGQKPPKRDLGLLISALERCPHQRQYLVEAFVNPVDPRLKERRAEFAGLVDRLQVEGDLETAETLRRWVLAP